MISAVERAHLAALAGFDYMTTPRLLSLCSGRSPVEAYAMASGDAPPSPPIAAALRRFPELASRWKASAQTATPDNAADRCASLGVRIVVPGDPEWPPQLLDDPRRPAVLFMQGDAGALERRRVGIVGTRNPTRRGAQIAA